MLRKRKRIGLLAAAFMAAVGVLATQIAGAVPGPAGSQSTRTPIKHVVVIFQENVSFDHYFGTYPTATNTDGQTFVAAPGTPAVDGLTPATAASIPAALQHSTDLTASNTNVALPQRLDPSPNGPVVSSTGSADGSLTSATGTATSGSLFTGLANYLGYTLTDAHGTTNIPAGTTITAENNSAVTVSGLPAHSVTMSHSALATVAADTFTVSSTSGTGEITCDQDHNYSDEQQAFDGGLMDQFVQSVGTDGTSRDGGGGTTSGGPGCDPRTVMDYYDGNAVTGLWNYAQHYAMSDNSFGTTFGPSAPGAVNLASGDTGGVDTSHESTLAAGASAAPSVATSAKPNADITLDGSTGGYSLTGDAQPYWDDCSTRDAVALNGTNIGDELNAAGLSWGWFQGGFRPTTSFATAATTAGHPGQSTATFIPDEFASFAAPANASKQAICDAVHPVGVALGETAASHQFGFKDDYIAHHEPFQFYATTANPHHLTIATDLSGNDLVTGSDSLSSVGTDTQSYVNGQPQFDTPNHNYDTSDFDQLVAAINAGHLPASALPTVTFLKAPGYEDGHPAYSDPADEQAFVTSEINALMKSPDWSSTAVFVSYDDSDGWYDHVYSGVTNPSLSLADNLTNTTTGTITGVSPHTPSGQCGPKPQTTAPLAGQQARCGFGPRLPMIVVSPWAKTNYVDHNLSDQSSIINFIEYNWQLPGIPGSADQVLASKDAAEGVPFDLAGLFDFKHPSAAPTFPLDPSTGQFDLTNASIDGQNLKGQNLSGAEASGASVRGANLQGAFLADIDLANADVQGTNLQGADLAGANLSGASLKGTNLEGADLTGANLQGAILQGANTHDVTWSDTTCVDGTNSNADDGTCQGHL